MVGVRITLESACVSNEWKILAGVKSSLLSQVSLKPWGCPKSQGTNWKILLMSTAYSLTRCLTWSPTSSMESHHKKWLQDAWPTNARTTGWLSDMAIWGCKHKTIQWYSRKAVPTTSQRTVELMQYMEAALRGPQRIVICKIYVHCWLKYRP